MDAAAWRLVGILSVPHWLYAFIWFWPKAFQALCGKTDAVDVFSRTAYALKAIQFAACYVWCTQDAPLDLLAAPLPRIAACLALGAAGQLLNGGIYKAIGKKGVYYGYKLGHTVPWCTDFPFSLGIRHPQYVGSVLTLWGFVALLWDPAQRPALLHVALAWTGLYGVTAVIEDKF